MFRIGMSNGPNCKSCGYQVEKQDAEVFEGMHWLCFHFAFEHNANPDEPCRSRNCPSWHLQILKAHIQEQGDDPDSIINTEIERIWSQENKHNKTKQ